MVIVTNAPLFLNLLIVFLLDDDLDTVLNYDKLHIITPGRARLGEGGVYLDDKGFARGENERFACD